MGAEPPAAEYKQGFGGRAPTTLRRFYVFFFKSTVRIFKHILV